MVHYSVPPQQNRNHIWTMCSKKLSCFLYLYSIITCFSLFFIDFPSSTAHKPKVAVHWFSALLKFLDVKCRSFTRLGGQWGKQFSGQLLYRANMPFSSLFQVSVRVDFWDLSVFTFVAVNSRFWPCAKCRHHPQKLHTRHRIWRNLNWRRVAKTLNRKKYMNKNQRHQP